MILVKFGASFLVIFGEKGGQRPGEAKADGGGRGARIMDLDQYLEKMNTNTKIIWIQNIAPIFILILNFKNRILNLQNKIEIVAFFSQKKHF